MARLQELGDLPVGSAVITPGGDLPASFVIHVVVQSPEEPVTSAGVRRGLVNALRRASEFSIGSVALPPMGVGPGNLDAEEAARVLEDVVSEHLQAGEEPHDLLIVVESEYEMEVFGRLAPGG
jgi:O-acetyl-ADP-ribose deacetylase (regulator of RNase III)